MDLNTLVAIFTILGAIAATIAVVPILSSGAKQAFRFLQQRVVGLYKLHHNRQKPGRTSGPHGVSLRVFICHSDREPALHLAEEFYQTLISAGHQSFMATKNIQVGENWTQRLDAEIEQCDYFLLLLCEASGRSEMVTEAVSRVKQLQQARSHPKPIILPVRVAIPATAPLNYHLRAYLHGIHQAEWHNSRDTPRVIQEIISLLNGPTPPMPPYIPAAGPLPPRVALPSNTPPLPIAEPELPGGQVDQASEFYVERPPIERDCYQEILKPGALIRIKAPRQMGKPSLMSRILYQAANQGDRTVSLSFQIADRAIFADLEQFLKWFCANVAIGLQLPHQIAEHWDDILGTKVNCKAYFEKYLLPRLNSALVLGLDEVDLVFQYPGIAADFFGLLRNWHEESKNQEVWKKLRLIVVHSTEVYIPLDINQSPFNVGLPIELPEFTPAQILDLAQRHHLDWDETQVGRLMELVGGHPYLVRVALYHLSRQEITLDDLWEIAPTESGLYRDHLRRHLWNLEQHSDLYDAMLAVVNQATPVRLSAKLSFQLNSMGLVRLDRNEVVPRCNLYREYFRDRLLEF